MSKLNNSGTTQDICTININIQAEKAQCDLIDSAAKKIGKSRSDFLWETACREAESVLLGQKEFVLDEPQWQSFINALDTPVQSRPRLENLMGEKTVSEQ